MKLPSSAAGVFSDNLFNEENEGKRKCRRNTHRLDFRVFCRCISTLAALAHDTRLLATSGGHSINHVPNEVLSRALSIRYGQGKR